MTEYSLRAKLADLMESSFYLIFCFSEDAFATNGMNSSSYASFKAGKFADICEKWPELFVHQFPDLDGGGWRQNSTTNGSTGHRFPHTWRQ